MSAEMASQYQIMLETPLERVQKLVAIGDNITHLKNCNDPECARCARHKNEGYYQEHRHGRIFWTHLSLTSR
jgi:hypothetical protein